ncbi:MAG: SOS response-associated peptidase [Actinomycetota bacterium]|nr:SOS response-associated peptidase [Actinomycetota bacterium]
MDPETLYGVFDAEPDPVAPPGVGMYGGDEPRPRYNIAPTDLVAVVRVRPERDSRPAGRFVGEARWGLVPSWAKDLSVGSKMFNARAESVPDKSAFRAAFDRRRCLVPATGYYEWQKVGKDSKGKLLKQPYFITPADGSVMAFAGLWEFWRSPAGDPVISTTIITTPAPGPMAQIHDRMPLVLPASEWAPWLDPSVSGGAVRPLLLPPAAELIAALELRPVGQAVGNVRNDSADLITRAAPGR